MRFERHTLAGCPDHPDQRRQQCGDETTEDPKGQQQQQRQCDQLRASQIVLEYANRGMDDLPRWGELATDKELGAGVIDVKAFRAETAAEVAERIRAILRHVPADKLWLNPDCGFAPGSAAKVSMDEVYQKLRNQVDAAKRLRAEFA